MVGVRQLQHAATAVGEVLDNAFDGGAGATPVLPSGCGGPNTPLQSYWIEKTPP